MLKKYTVTEAVWIAAALMAAEQYTKIKNVTKDDMYFKQADIVRRAQTLTRKKVDAARVSWWTNADAKKHTQNFLRGDLNGNESLRRLAMIDEFEDKTFPQGLNMNDKLEMCGQEMTMEELFFFVKEQYPPIILNTSKDEYWPSIEEYDPGITKEMWAELLCDSEVTAYANLRMFKMMLEVGGESTCANLASTYGGTAGSYNGLGRAFGERVYKKTGCPLCVDEGRERFYTIPFVGRPVFEINRRRYSWKLRPELKEALEDMDLSEIDITEKNEDIITYDKNMILYGPPGTGKTYSSAIYAVAICDGKPIDEIKDMDYDDVMIRYKELMKEERVAFTTFHQSYGYEEFIEGIKPVIGDGGTDLGYTIEDGIFKKFCSKASAVKIETKEFEVPTDAVIWKVTIREDVIKDCFENNRVRIDWGMDSDGARGFVNDIKKGDIIISTDGSRRIINGIAVVGEDDAFELSAENDATTRNVKWLAKNIGAEIVDINNGKMLHRMTVARVPYMKVGDIINLAKANNTEWNSATIVENKAPHVFIIDEINRGNISKIFGELITLIEDTKRAGMNEEASAILPYSGALFSVPSNVYILGTMNTADRSIAFMDTALRRRFQFIEMMPDADILRNIGADMVEDLDVALMLEKINERIAFLYDREHTIGHAFFTKLAANPSIEVMASIFEKSVIPLLQEYFYEDYQKIQMVLGDNGKTVDSHKFILDQEVKVKEIFKGSVDYAIDLPEKTFRINPEAFFDINSYKEIL